MRGMWRRAGPTRLVVGLSGALAVAIVAAALGAGSGGWDHLGDGGSPGTGSLDGAVYALNPAAPGALYVGGAFTSAGGSAAAARIAKWDGTAWSPVGSPVLNGNVNAIAVDAGKVYVGGTFTNAGGDPDADFLAVWNGASWAPFCAPITSTVSALQIIGRKLYIGGGFADGAGIASGDRLIACDLDTGAANSTVSDEAHEFTGNGIFALAADSNGVLYAAGRFLNIEGDPAADNVAYLDGTGWHAMGTGAGACACAVDDAVRALTVAGTSVYIGTDAEDVAGIPQADNVARWNGSTWSAMGSDTSGADGWFPPGATMYALTHDGANVYAAGSFPNANGDPTADNVAQFDGSAWHPMGSDGAGNGPFSGAGLVLAVFAGQVTLGGSFTSVGGDTQAHGIARFGTPAAPEPTPTPSPPPESLRPPAPTVTITSPAPNAFFNHPEQVLVSGTVAAPGGLAKFCVVADAAVLPITCDDVAQVHADGSFTNVPIPASLVPGANTITAYAVDASGQQGHASVSVELPNGLDLRALSMEVNQSIQRFSLPINLGLPIPYSGVKLVAGATTVVRVYANAFTTGRDGGQPIPNVPALLVGTRNGAPLPGSPLSPGSGPATLAKGPLAVHLADIADPRSGYTFTLPISWTMGAPIQLKAIVNPPGNGSFVPEAYLTNNSFALTGIGFEHRSPLLISPVEMVYQSLRSQTMVVPHDPATVFAGARLITPIGDGQLMVLPYRGTIDLSDLYAFSKGKPDSEDILFNGTWGRVAEWEEHHNEGGVTIGVVGDADARGRAQPALFSNPPRLESVAFVNQDRLFTSVTHELWHTQGYLHAGHVCTNGSFADFPFVAWPPDDQGYIQGMGLDRTPGSGGAPGTYRRLIAGALTLPPLSGQEPEYYDAMSYCSFALDKLSWVSTRTWDSWGSGPAPLLVPTRAARLRSLSAAAGRTLRVVAAVNSNGTGEITQVRPGSEAAASVEGSAYRIVVRNAGGAVISSTGIKSQGTHVDYEPGHVGAEVVADVPAEGASSVELTHDGKVIASKARSAHPPTVKLLSPKAGTSIGSTGNVAVRWKAADADGDPLEVTLSYSADGGRHFTNLAIGGFAGATKVPAALFGKATDGRIRITVNDGFDEASALSGRLRAAGGAPVVRILTPAQTVRADAGVALLGQAFEATGKAITAAGRLTWFDGRRRIARGPRTAPMTLSPGTHRLSLQVRGAGGGTARATVAIKVLGVKPDLLVTAPKSVSRKARTVKLKVGSTVPGVLSAGGRTFPVGRAPRAVTIPVKPGSKPLVLRLRVRAGAATASYTVTITRGRAA
jgi:hypothetical protein